MRDDTKAFLTAVRTDVPDARVVVVGVNPSINRWPQFAAQTKANAYVKEVCAADPKATYLDAVQELLGPGGGPPPADLLVKDELHLSEKGYAILTAVVAKAVAP